MWNQRGISQPDIVFPMHPRILVASDFQKCTRHIGASDGKRKHSGGSMKRLPDDQRFAHVSYHSTNLRVTFARERARLKAAALLAAQARVTAAEHQAAIDAEALAKVAPIKRAAQ